MIESAGERTRPCGRDGGPTGNVGIAGYVVGEGAGHGTALFKWLARLRDTPYAGRLAPQRWGKC